MRMSTRSGTPSAPIIAPIRPSISPSLPLMRKPASQSEAKPINDFIYLSEGLSNAYLITTAEGRIVVNTGMGFESPVHKRNFDAVDPSPLRAIILTQGHPDHVGGVDREVADHPHRHHHRRQ